jgi:hypothetical protein
MVGQNKRDVLLKEALLILLGAELPPQLEPHAELGLWDDEIIRQFEVQIEQRIAELPAHLRASVQSVAANMEADPQAVGGNGTMVHALAVEAFVAVRDFFYSEPADTPAN